MSLPNIFVGYASMYWSVYAVCIIGAISQVVLLICLIKDPLRCFRNSSTYLVANLAVSDLAVVLEMIFGTFNSLEPHVRSVSHVSFFASLLTILSIAVDRYVMVVHPFKHRFVMSGSKALIWIMVLWIASFASPLYFILAGSLHKISELKYAFLGTVTTLTALLYIFTCVALTKHQSVWQMHKRNRFAKLESQARNDSLKPLLSSPLLPWSALLHLQFTVRSLSRAWIQIWTAMWCIVF